MRDPRQCAPPEQWTQFLATHYVRSGGLRGWAARATAGMLTCGLAGTAVVGVYGRPGFGFLFAAAVAAVGSVGAALMRQRCGGYPRRWVWPPRRGVAWRPVRLGLPFAAVGGVVGTGVAVPAYGWWAAVPVVVVLAATFGAAPWLTAPADLHPAANVRRVLADDRRVVGRLAVTGAVAGGVVGGYLGVLQGLHPARLAIGLPDSPVLLAVIGIVCGIVTGGLGLGLLAEATSEWGQTLLAGTGKR